MKASFILSLSLLLITPLSYSQDSSIVSLNIGNKWYYNYSYHSQSPSGSESVHRIEIKEVIGDTILWDGKAYKKILVTSIGDTNITTRLQYWGKDSIIFYYRGVEFLGDTWDTFYDTRIVNDTSWGNIHDYYYTVVYSQKNIWGIVRNHQSWYSEFDGPGVYISELSSTALGVGPVRIEISIGYKSGGGVSGTNILFGAVIDGVVYGDTTTVGVNWNKKQPTNFILFQNYPNPFNPITNIGFRIVERGFVSLKVYDVLGNEIATLLNEEKQAGSFEVEFNVDGLTSGIYFYKLQVGSSSTGSLRQFVETKKMVLIK